MKFGLNKIRAAFGNSNASEQTNTENNIEDIISSVDGDAFGISEENVLFAKTSELGGYFYIITIIVGSFKIKTNKGATLALKGNNFDLVLKTDMDEFESDRSGVKNRYVTRIDFQIEEDDVAKFDTKIISSLKLSAKKQVVLFETLS